MHCRSVPQLSAHGSELYVGPTGGFAVVEEQAARKKQAAIVR
jgi:hypothetical protein